MPEFFTAPLVVSHAEDDDHDWSLNMGIWEEGNDDRAIIATHMHDTGSLDYNPRILHLLTFSPDTGDILTRKGNLVEHPGAYACALAHLVGDDPTDDHMRWITATLVFAFILEQHPESTAQQVRMTANMFRSLGKWRARRDVKSAMHAVLCAEAGRLFADAMRPAHKGGYCHPEEWERVFGSYPI